MLAWEESVTGIFFVFLFFKMSTNLAKQLRAIKSAKISLGEDVGVRASKTKPSVMFNPKEAADYDLETIFELGLSGLMELDQISGNAFSRYQKTLFSGSLKNFNRSLKSAAENDKLNKELSSFFKTLVPYFRNENAPKVLEYMIRAFRVEEMNVDDLMLNFLPFHSSDLFLKLMRIIRVAENGRWSFLANAKKNDVAPDRSFLVARMVSDYSIIDSYLNTVRFI